MEHFIIIISIICISLSGTNVASGYDQQLSSPTVLPRKLRLSENHEMKKDYYGGHQDLAPRYAGQEVFSGKAQKKEEKKKQPSIETWREWVEGGDTSQYFTMDYSRVRRRRPIHNKSLPVAP